MYIDVIILLVLLLLSIFIFRKFSSFIYSIALIDIFLRIIYYIATHLPINLGDVTNYIITYFPKSIADIISKYTNGIVCDLLMWVYIAFMAVFWFYTASYFVNKKK
jgi:hypothetical protein